MNAGTCPLLNSAGRCSATTDHTGRRCRPRAVRRSSWYACCTVSTSGACHQTSRSASARSPATSYQPRTSRSFAASPPTTCSTSAASAERSSGSGPAAAKTDHIVYRIVSLIWRADGRLRSTPPWGLPSLGTSLMPSFSSGPLRDHRSPRGQRFLDTRGGGPRGGDAGRDADAGEGCAADRETGHSRHRRLDPLHRLDVTDGGLRQGTAPAGDANRHRPQLTPEQRGEIGEGER